MLLLLRSLLPPLPMLRPLPDPSIVLLLMLGLDERRADSTSAVSASWCRILIASTASSLLLPLTLGAIAAAEGGPVLANCEREMRSL